MKCKYLRDESPVVGHPRPSPACCNGARTTVRKLRRVAKVAVTLCSCTTATITWTETPGSGGSMCCFASLPVSGLVFNENEMIFVTSV